MTSFIINIVSSVFRPAVAAMAIAAALALVSVESKRIFETHLLGRYILNVLFSYRTHCVGGGPTGSA